MFRTWIGVVSGAAEPGNVFFTMFQLENTHEAGSSSAVVQLGTQERSLIVVLTGITGELEFQFLKTRGNSRRYIWQEPDFTGAVPSDGTCAEIRYHYNVFIYASTSRELVAAAVTGKLKECGLI